MTFGLIFWIMMLLWLVLDLYRNYSGDQRFILGGNLMLFILFLLLGWKVFGAPIHG